MADSEKEVKIRISAEDDGASKKFKEVELSNKELRDGLNKTTIAFTAMAAVGVAAIYKVIAASDAQEQAILKLNRALEQTGENTEAMRKKVENFASNLQQLTGIADEVLIPSLSRLAMEFGSMDMAMQALPGLMAAAEIKGVDLNTVIRGTESALNGQTGALSRYGISLEDASSAQAVLNGILSETEKFLPQLGISTETLAGKLRVISANIRDLLEPFGKAFGDIFLPFADWLRQITIDIGPFVEAMAPIISKLVLIGTIVSGLIASITGLTAAILTGLMAWAKWGELLTGIAGILLAAIGPTGWIVIGITAVISTMLIFRDEVGAVFDFIKSGIQGVWNFMKNIPFFGWIFSGLEELAGAFGDFFSWLTENSKPVFEDMAAMAIWAAGKFYEAFASAWNWIASGINASIQRYNAVASQMGLNPTTAYVAVMPGTFEGVKRYFSSGEMPESEETTKSSESFGYKSPAAEAAGEGLPGSGAYQEAFSGAYGGKQEAIPTVETGVIQPGVGIPAGTPAGIYSEEAISAGISEAAAFIETKGQAQYFAGEINSLWSVYRGLKYEEQMSLGTVNNQAATDKLLASMAQVIKNVQPNIVLNVQGTVVSENNLIENMKKALKASGQSGDAYNF